MSGYYDDNFGHWDMSDPDSVDFYHEVQRTNVRKKCSGCKRMVNIQPQYALCNSCADKAERGMEFMCEDDGDGEDEGEGE